MNNLLRKCSSLTINKTSCKRIALKFSLYCRAHEQPHKRKHCL